MSEENKEIKPAENLEQLEHIAKQAEQNEKQQAADGEYIPNDSGASQAEPKQDNGEAIAFLYKTVFEIVAARKGAHWVLAKDEALALGAATDDCLPEDTELPPWATLAVVGCTVVAPRIMIDAEIAKKQAAAEAKEAEGAKDGD